MKKLTLAGAILALSGSALASSPQIEDNNFYVKLFAAGGMGHTVAKDDDLLIKNQDNTKVTKENNKFGSYNLSFGGAAGYSILENVRAEAQFSYVMGPKWEFAETTKVTLTAEAFTGFLNGSVDVIDMNPIKLYVNAGAGISYLSAEIELENQTDKIEFEKKINFAYNVGAGISYEASPGMTVELGYSFVNYGTLDKSTEKTNPAEYLGESLKSHNINLGLRINI
jgi:opacity protein-like surface antigen